MNEQTINTIISLIGAGIIGWLIKHFSYKKQKKRIEVEHYYTSMPLLMFNPSKERSIKVSVDKSLLTGDENYKGQFEEINNAFGFSIQLKNTGNEASEKIKTIITLDENATIIEYNIKTNSVQKEEINVEIDPNNKNKLNLKIPYLNEGDSIFIAVVATGVKKSDFCQINVLGKGVKSVKLGRFRTILPYIFLIIFWLVALEIILNLGKYVSKDFASMIGFKEKTIQIFQLPILHKIIIAISFIGSGFYIFRKLFFKLTGDTHTPWM